MTRSDRAIRQDWVAKLVIRRALLAHAERGLAWARKHDRPNRGWRVSLVAKRKAQVAEAEKVVARHTPKPLRTRAYKVASSQVGVMESGGNNQGTPFLRYIKANDGTAPESWCGDFVAYCYSRAGSKSVTRAWAAVRLFLPLTGLKRVQHPERGDIVRFTFDHVGIYSRHLNNGWIETIEGNTGSTGAVSDSTTGGDGVYRKDRPSSVVLDYIRVSA